MKIRFEDFYRNFSVYCTDVKGTFPNNLCLGNHIKCDNKCDNEFINADEAYRLYVLGKKRVGEGSISKEKFICKLIDIKFLGEQR